MIDEFTKNNIIAVDEKFSDLPKKITESIPEKKKIWSINSYVDRWVRRTFNFIKRITDQNENVGTTIDNKRYALNDANEWANKITKAFAKIIPVNLAMLL